MTSESVMKIFGEITTIPRESGHEEPVTTWLQKWAADHKLACKTDATGNVLITRAAAPGKENVPAIVLQAHQDMVCEKNAGVQHDFTKDPIRYEIEDGWMIAKDTTLGADDGIGIAACLALLEDATPTGKVECLFTISEETGMDGAMALQSGFFEGKTLINLDSEDEGQLFIGCSGGLNTNIKFTVSHEPVLLTSTVIKVKVGGGQGGHSGDDINKGRANAVQLMARFLAPLMGKGGIQLISLCGGGKPNAIARECEAVLAVRSTAAIRRAAKVFDADLKEEFHVTDPGMYCNVEAVSNAPEMALASADAAKIVLSLLACPHGMQAMSQDIPGLVQTSTNLASVKMLGRNKVEIVTSQRSSSTSERRAMAARVRAAFELAGADVRHMYEYPGWNPDVNSPILKVCVDSYKRLFGEDPQVLAIHAGLECGLFLEMFPGLDMISFGPTLRGVHAPGERLELASVDKFVKLLEDVVVNFS